MFYAISLYLTLQFKLCVEDINAVYPMTRQEKIKVCRKILTQEISRDLKRYKNESRN